MISLFIFYIHLVGFTAAFTHQYQREDTKAGFLMIAFMVIIFSVGWTITTFILNYLISDAGFGPSMNRDTISLLLLTIGEGIFYYEYFKEKPKKNNLKESV